MNATVLSRHEYESVVKAGLARHGLDDAQAEALLRARWPMAGPDVRPPLEALGLAGLRVRYPLISGPPSHQECVLFLGANTAPRLRISRFSDGRDPHGFGLLQRERVFHHYQDQAALGPPAPERVDPAVGSMAAGARSSCSNSRTRASTTTTSLCCGALLLGV